MDNRTSPLDDGSASYEPTPGLYRLTAAARRCGMSADTFAAAADRGDIPVRIVRVGPRGLRFVRVTELSAFLAGETR